MGQDNASFDFVAMLAPRAGPTLKVRLARCSELIVSIGCRMVQGVYPGYLFWGILNTLPGWCYLLQVVLLSYQPYRWVEVINNFEFLSWRESNEGN